jgi:general secretion pathway protein F
MTQPEVQVEWPARDPRKPLWKRVGKFLIVCAGLVAISAVFGAFVAAGLLLIGVWWLALALIGVAGWNKRRDAQRRALLRLIAVAAERQIPLAAAVEALSRECFGLFAWRLRRLAGLLADGVSLPVAVSAVGNVLPRATLPLVHAGYACGALVPALRLGATAGKPQEPLWKSLVDKLVYLFLVVWLGLCLVTFMVIKIVPQYQRIFADFSVQLPPATEALIASSKWFANSWGWLFPGFAAAMFLFMYVVLRYAGCIQLDLPGMAWLARRLHTAAILDALALAAEHRQPLDAAVATLAIAYPQAAVRRRLARSLRDLRDGTDWCESLLRRGLLGRADVAVLQAAARVGNLPWAMREMADSNRRRFTYRLHAWVQIMFPVALLVCGAAVMFIMLAFFMPVMTLIEKLSAQ